MATGLPGVSGRFVSGQLGRSNPSPDRVPGLVMSGIAVTDKIAIGEGKLITSLKDAEDLGLTAAYDTTNSLMVHKHIAEFYAEAPVGQSLYILLTSQATTLAQAADKANSHAAALLTFAQGKITHLGITRCPADTYTFTVTEGFDPDSIAALPKAQELAEERSAAPYHAPVRCLVEMRAFNGNFAQAKDLNAATHNRVMAVAYNHTVGTGYASKGASVGAVLGKICSVEPSVNIGEVAQGPLVGDAPALSSGVAVSAISLGNLNTLHDKGYVFARSFTGRDGFFLNDDRMACARSDDYSSLARGSVVDKGYRRTYLFMLDYVNAKVPTDVASGKISGGYARALEGSLRNRLEQDLVASDDCQGVQVVCPLDQTPIQSDELEVEVGVLPFGYSKYISFTIGQVSSLTA